MTQLLLELFSEEIPAQLQIKVVEDFETGLSEKLKEHFIDFKSIKAYATPRRVSLVINGLPKILSNTTDERRGPRVDAPQDAINGFLKSTGLTKEDLEVRKLDKGEFYFAVIKKKGGLVSEVLSKIFNEFIASYTWPKSMRWNNNDIRWIRPLHNILCLYNGEILDLKFGHIKSNNKSYGHRFLNPKEFEVVDFDDYNEKLKNSFVILDIKDRKEIISKNAKDIAHSLTLRLADDVNLLNEVAGLVEFPVVLLGSIDKRFMSLPQEVLITAMRSHQKYFSLLNDKGTIAPHFIVVSNMKSQDNGARIIDGNERVLRARLEDAKFFWDKDKNRSLESRFTDLKKVIFHAKLGSVADKVERMVELSKLLSIWIPHANLLLVERSAKLCKADLTTEMVGEFPELQGLMGYYYALEAKEDKQVALAIREHYSPNGPKDVCPSSPVSIAVALADKIDSLIGLFSVNEKPTGSKDPYALRRAAIGVIRIILENNLRIPLHLLLEKSIAKYPKSLFRSESKPKGFLRVSIKKEGSKDKKTNIVNELLSFFADRLKVVLKDLNIRHDVIQAVFDDGNEDDLTRLVARASALNEFMATNDGINLHAAYKRATNIVLAEEKKDDTQYKNLPDDKLFESDNEKELFKLFTIAKSNIAKDLKADKFDNIMKELALFRQPIDNFLENTVVNAKDNNIRVNRLLLLAQFRCLLAEVANFNKIEV